MVNFRLGPIVNCLKCACLSAVILCLGCTQGEEVSSSSVPSAVPVAVESSPVSKPADQQPETLAKVTAPQPAPLPDSKREADETKVVQTVGESAQSSDSVPTPKVNNAPDIREVADDDKQTSAKGLPEQKGVVDKKADEAFEASQETEDSVAKSEDTPVVKNKSANKSQGTSIISSLLKAFNTPSNSKPVLDDDETILIQPPSPVTKDDHRRIKVKASVGWLSLQTFCVDHEGHLIALLGTSRYAEEKGKNSEVQILSPEGDVLKEWKLSFSGQSINVGPDHLVYIAGDGKVAKYDNEGNELALVNLPHIEEMITDKDKMRKDAEDLLKQQSQSYDRLVESTEKRLEKAKAEAEKDEKSKIRLKGQIQSLESQVKMYREIAEQQAKQNLDKVINQQLARLKIINSIAVSEKDVFLVCGDNKGYGYNLWRTDLGFHDAKLVIKGLRGCCGQMDVQVAGDEIVVAENTLHKYGRYDREGKLVGKYGKKSRGRNSECFGGCCNPMNVRATPNGDILTAESEGVIKRFSAKGEFQGEVGKCALTGGCKNVAVAVSPDNKYVYFCDQPGSQIVVLEMPAQEVADTE